LTNKSSPTHIGIYNYENQLCRIYDPKLHSSEHIFLNEVSFFLKDLINKDLKLFFISTTYKQHNHILPEDLDFFKKLRHGDSELPDNLKKLRDLQSEDLLYFYDNLICEMFCVFSEITDNMYHYNLLIAVKPNFVLNSFFNVKFNLIEIVSIKPIFDKDISFDYMKFLFNFDKLMHYNFYHYNEPIFNKVTENLELLLKDCKEYSDFEDFYKKHPKLSEINEELYKQYLYLLNDKCGLRSESLDQRIYYSYIFKSFG
jgi:hypothetical protein